MLREFIIFSYVAAINGRWNELGEFFALTREVLANTTRLSPEDQSKLDEIFQRATTLKSKEDNAQK